MFLRTCCVTQFLFCVASIKVFVVLLGLVCFTFFFFYYFIDHDSSIKGAFTWSEPKITCPILVPMTHFPPLDSNCMVYDILQNLAHQWTNTFHGCLWFSTRAICWNRRTKYAHQFKLLLTYAAILKIIFLSLCSYYLGWISCLISFVLGQSNSQKQGTNENYKMKNFCLRRDSNPRPV